MNVLLVALGALVGAPARYLTDWAVTSRWRRSFPLGTLTVNVVASFVLGVTVGLGSRLAPHLDVLVATGFCGALSTFSTFSYEVLALGRDGRGGTAAGYLVGSAAAGLGFGALGWLLGTA